MAYCVHIQKGRVALCDKIAEHSGIVWELISCSAVAGVMKSSMKIEQATDTIPVVEEDVAVEKHRVVTGRVRVRTVTETVDDIAHATLEEQNIEVRRVPVERIVEAPPSVRTEGNVTIIPVLEEVLVVEKLK